VAPLQFAGANGGRIDQASDLGPVTVDLTLLKLGPELVKQDQNFNLKGFRFIYPAVDQSLRVDQRSAYGTKRLWIRRQSMSALPRFSDIDLFGNGKRIVHLDPEIADRTLDLRVA
jgi:hypothetical protein